MKDSMFHIFGLVILVSIVVSSFALGSYYGPFSGDDEVVAAPIVSINGETLGVAKGLPSDWVEPLLVTITWTPSNPVRLVNTGEVDGIQAKYECVNNNLSINFITEYKVLRNNSHYIVSERLAPEGYMVDLHPTDEVMYCTGWSNDY